MSDHLIATVVLISSFALAVTASAQQPSTAAPRDTAAVADTSQVETIEPTTARQAEALGIKLVGLYDSRTGDWIPRAILRDTLGNEVATSSIGVAALNAFPPVAGYYMLEIRKEGYAPKRVTLSASKGSEFLVALDPRPLGEGTELPAVIVRAAASLRSDAGRASGFAHRCELGVKCISRAVLDRRPTGGLAEFLELTPGIHRTCGGGPSIGPDPKAQAMHQLDRSIAYDSVSTGCLAEMAENMPSDLAHPYCVPAYFVNGFRFIGGPGVVPVQQQIDAFYGPNAIAGIEVYLSNEATPPRFSRQGSSCGAVVIWTR